METTPLGSALLGKTGLDITRVGFGAWAIGGGGWEFGWGPQDDDEAVAAIHHALELGVNWIDTAAAYGFGRSEQSVGRALDGLRDHERPYVVTKASLVEGPGRTMVHNLKRESPGAVAIAWTLRNPAVDGAIVGFRRPGQVDPLVGAADLRLDASDIAAIEGKD